MWHPLIEEGLLLLTGGDASSEVSLLSSCGAQRLTFREVSLLCLYFRTSANESGMCCRTPCALLFYMQWCQEMWLAERKALALANLNYRSELEFDPLTPYRGNSAPFKGKHILDLHVPYQSPYEKFFNLCWVSIVVACHQYLYNDKLEFQDVCSSFDKSGKCVDKPVDLGEALLRYNIDTKWLGEDLSDQETIDNAIESLNTNYPLVLRLEKSTVTDSSTHFIMIGGYDNTKKNIQWYIKDPSGAYIDGNNVPDKWIIKKLRKKYEMNYTIVGVYKVYQNSDFKSRGD